MTYTRNTCPDLSKYHTPGQPSGYLQWGEWAAKKSKTHRQEPCPTCGLLMVWVPKDAS